MPSALETLVKILKLERDQGCKNTAVIGGLAAFSEKWTPDAHAQAKKPEHHLLVDELSGLLEKYEAVPNKSERLNNIGYMLDRITGRVPPPPEFQAKLAEMQTQTVSPPLENRDSPPAPPPLEQREQRREEHHPVRDERPPRRDRERPPRQPQPQQQSKPPRKPSRNNDDDDDGDEFSPEERGREMSYDSYDAPLSRGKGGKGRGPQTAEMDVPATPRLARVPRHPRPKISAEEAADIMRGLEQPVTVAKGVGTTTAQLLEKLGIRTVGDLLDFLPRRYDDYTHLRTISQLTADEDSSVTVIGTVIHTEVRVGRSGRRDFFMILDDGTARMGVSFFGQHFLMRAIKSGNQVVVSGTTSLFRNQIQMINPEWEALDVENLHTIGIIPVYPLTEGLGSKSLRKLMKSTIGYWAERVPDFVPEATLERTELADLGWMYKNLHFPEGPDHLQHARDRFIFNDLLLLQLTVLANRREWQSVPAQPLQVWDEYLERFIQEVFPYPLTGAQMKAVNDIRRDVGTSRPMNRLVQGDVGSGKTAVAIVAIAMALMNGKQAALMVPTSILAEQHYRNVGATLEKMPGDRKPVVALLTGSLTETERQSIYRGMADGSIDLVIGTHALIQAGVEFKDLGVAIIDEQHRFGVEQRKALRGKGTNPHLLVMTATPIPRTLALTLYADLDLTILDEMPPGRIPIQTRVVDPVARERIYNFVENELKQGRQAFVVHPLVEESEKIDAPAAVEAYERLQKVFFRYRVGLLHGRMRPAEKDAVMEAFSSGKYDVLVTTSVAEVGVNVPNASVMIIEGANRFGLAQLHQFRGRVGRGEHASYCLLVSDTNDDDARARLQVMEDTNDGFKLAEMDWKLRGAGDLVGTRQSGGSLLHLVKEMTPHLVELAQREARTIFEEDPTLSQEQHRLLAQRVGMLHNERTDVS
ncbi:MAG: ATP-dependent DNA helicase RecG [Chloroflexota bacterium]